MNEDTKRRMTSGFLRKLLSLDNDDEYRSLDLRYSESDITEESTTRVQSECTRFAALHPELLMSGVEPESIGAAFAAARHPESQYGFEILIAAEIDHKTLNEAARNFGSAWASELVNGDIAIEFT